MAPAPTKILSLEEILTLPRLYNTQILRAVPASAKPHNSAFNSKIALIQHDITKLDVAAVVNAANKHCLGGSGVDSAIHRAAGEGLLVQCRTLGGCDTGDAKITGSYLLPGSHVIHAVGPMYWLEETQSIREDLLRSCYRRSLKLADQHSCKSVAFPAISTGVYGYPSHEAAHAAISEVRAYLEQNPDSQLEKVVFCNFEDKDQAAYVNVLPHYFPPEEKSKTAAEPVHEEKSKSAAEPVQEIQPKSKGNLDKDWFEVDKGSATKHATVEDAPDEGP